MAKLIALRSGFNDNYFHAWRSNYSSQLKQQALLFDQIGILKLGEMYGALSTFREYPDLTQNRLEPLISELKWLEESGIIFESSIQEELKLRDAEFISETEPQKFKELKTLNKSLEKILKTQKTNTRSIEDVAAQIDSIKREDAIILRLISIVMETIKGASVVTMLPHTEYSRKLPNSNNSNVVQILISKLPLPNNETPWEQIIDYRNDSENQKNLLSLRRWIRKISSENLPSAEIEEELEWLISEFQNHMKFHKMKANTETLEVMVKTPLEVIENLLKLNLSKIPEPLFALKKRQINLMEAELNAPGKEMAYIIKAKDKFQSQE